jgi:hypothetical protein
VSVFVHEDNGVAFIEGRGIRAQNRGEHEWDWQDCLKADETAHEVLPDIRVNRNHSKLIYAAIAWKVPRDRRKRH